MNDIQRQNILRTGRWAVAALFFINGFVVGSWAPQIPGFVARLGIDESVLGLLILGFGLGALFAMTLAGQLVATKGSRFTLCLFAVPVIFTLPMAALAPNVWTAAVALIVFGGAIGGMDVAMNANVVAIEKQLRRAIMSSSHGFWSLGGFVGGGIGGIAINESGPVVHALIVATLTAIGVVLACTRIANEATFPRLTQNHWVFPKNRTIYVIGAIALLCMSAEGAVLNWSALYLQKELNADIATAGFAFAAFSGAMAVMRFAGDGIRNRHSAVTTFRLSALIAATGMLVVGLSQTPWLAIAAFAFCGAGLSNLAPILFSAAGNQPDLNTGVSMSIVTTMGHSGILLAPSIIGFVSGKVGLASIYIAVGVLLCIVSFMSGKITASDASFENTNNNNT